LGISTAVTDGLREGFFMFWETLWALVLGFALSGAVQAFVSRGQMEGVLGGEGRGRLGRATFLGMVSSSCSYAASAMAKSLFAKGADFTAALVFMIASTNLVIELGIVLALLIGWQFTASEFVGGFLMIALLAVVSRFTLPHRAVEAARRRLAGDADDAMDHGAAEDSLSGRERMRSLAGWSDAASYAMADMTMLRREMLIGFGVAGFLAVLVPDNVWSAVFVSNHGLLTSVENAIVGPFIAIISFVCSIGNVPLAAALWKGGISFGGVVSFVFADLITMPLLIIYRKFYGRKLTLWILGSFWLVMSVAGLVVEGVFSLLHLVPSTRPTQIAPERFAWDYTSVLDITFLLIFAGLYYLHRNRVRFGGGSGYAIDPVCGMQVETATAPAHAQRGGHAFWFCSDRCRSRFAQGPARLAARRSVAGAVAGAIGASVKASSDPSRAAESVIDVVCGMSVVPDDAAAHRSHDGAAYHFCSEGCATAFDHDRASFTVTQASAR
jgi:hypothetical protein